MPPKFIVTINRPFYPSVKYVESLKEAEQLRDELVREEAGPEGAHEVQVTIAQVISTTEITTSY